MAYKLTRSISSKRLTALINVARKSGLKRLKVGDVEFELGVAPQPVDKKSIEPEPEVERMPTEDEMLNWSTPFYDDIRETRAQASKPEAI